jgi:hypothetical protein
MNFDTILFVNRHPGLILCGKHYRSIIRPGPKISTIIPDSKARKSLGRIGKLATMDKVIPNLGDFQVMPSTLPLDGTFYLFRDARGASPDRVQPLSSYPRPVSQLDLSRRFWAEIKYTLPFWGLS